MPKLALWRDPGQHPGTRSAAGGFAQLIIKGSMPATARTATNGVSTLEQAMVRGTVGKQATGRGVVRPKRQWARRGSEF